MKILFSPVGGTDPISNSYDGALLHICRHYRPDIVYLYLSGEILEYHKQDNRYVYSIEKLGEVINHTFEIHLIEKPNLFNVQVFDDFLIEFRDMLSEIMKGREDSELILNVSSGTPAMKGALQTLSVFLTYKSIEPVQVSTPNKSMNIKTEDRNNFLIDLQWEYNMDNLEDAENRCTSSERMNLLVETQKRIIKKHIRSYNYQGAIEATKEIENFVTKEFIGLLRASLCRLQYNFDDMKKHVNEKRFNLLVNIPMKNKNVYEYLLNLKIKLVKEEYADFIRAISPYFYELLKIILKEKYGFDLKKYMNVRKQKEGIDTWELVKIQREPELMKIFDERYRKDRFRGEAIKSDHLKVIIEYYSEDQELKDKIEFVRKAEFEIRNVAAHQLSGIGKKEKGYSMTEILSAIKYLSVQAGLDVNNNVWKSYDYMNDLLIEHLYQ